MWLYEVIESRAPRHTGNLNNAAYPWGLPGMHCPEWLGGLQYPCVDLSGLPARELKKLSDSWPVSFEEFERLRELVRPLAPQDALLRPGMRFGSLTGAGAGSFGQLFLRSPWSLFAQREALERLQGTGLLGLQGGPVNVRFCQKRAPELREFPLVARGGLHPACLPPGRQPPCSRCGRDGVRLPSACWRDATSLAEHMDAFRLTDWPTLIFATERMVEAVIRLELDGVEFRQVEAR